MYFEINDENKWLRHYKSIIVPRPIGWITSKNSDDIINQIKSILKSIKSDIHEAAVNQRSDRIKQLLNQLLDEINENLKLAETNGVDKIQIDIGNELIFEVKDMLSKNQIDDAKAAYYELKELMKNIGN